MRESTCQITSELLQFVAKGNEDAFGQLFHRYSNKLYSFLRCHGATVQESEDVVQDVFMKIWLSREALQNIQHFEAYLFRASQNHFVNLLKRKTREKSILSILPGEQSVNSTEEKMQLKETEIAIKSALEELSPKQQQVFRMSRLEGLNQQEISKKLDITVPTVKSHMTIALRILRRAVKNIALSGKSLFWLLPSIIITKIFF